jgi:hypothetical protein
MVKGMSTTAKSKRCAINGSKVELALVEKGVSWSGAEKMGAWRRVKAYANGCLPIINQRRKWSIQQVAATGF